MECEFWVSVGYIKTSSLIKRESDVHGHKKEKERKQEEGTFKVINLNSYTIDHF